MRGFEQAVRQGIPDEIPEMPPEEGGIDHAPKRPDVLDRREKILAVRNALRYFPEAWHERLAGEFARELAEDGRIYIRRFRPHYAMHARPLDAYPARSRQAAAIMLMIQNNLDPAVAQHPYELITYGGNGTVFQNWAQYLLTMQYLSRMTDEQTLALYSGHPLGLFPSHGDAPRVVVTNGMVVPNYSSKEDYTRMAALGVTSYGQMTAGSGAQAKAAVIAGAVGVIAEINPRALKKRHEQGWLMEVETDLDALLSRVEEARRAKEAVSIGYLGNVVDLWERLVDADVEIELGSDQTSLHLPYSGGYYPVGLTLEESQRMMTDDPDGFRDAVQASLRRQFAAIRAMSKRGMSFWDYGNAFLLEASRAGAEGAMEPDGSFSFPSYVEDIMGPMCFDYGFGPFRWVCTSGASEDLATTDAIAADVLRKLAGEASAENRQQMLDNLHWIEQAADNELVVGSEARILYADREGRRKIAAAFNRAIGDGTIRGPIVLGRDHHDVSGTDSPFRETSNIRDGSMFTADMAVQNVIGDGFRGATWVSLHNGGGVGWGEVINGGFGLVLDGTEEAGRRAAAMLDWDVTNGVARRAWARNDGAIWAARQAMEANEALSVTLPSVADEALVADAVDG